MGGAASLYYFLIGWAVSSFPPPASTEKSTKTTEPSLVNRTQVKRLIAAAQTSESRALWNSLRTDVRMRETRGLVEDVEFR